MSTLKICICLLISYGIRMQKGKCIQTLKEKENVFLLSAIGSAWYCGSLAHMEKDCVRSLMQSRYSYCIRDRKNPAHIQSKEVGVSLLHLGEMFSCLKKKKDKNTSSVIFTVLTKQLQGF